MELGEKQGFEESGAQKGGGGSCDISPLLEMHVLIA